MLQALFQELDHVTCQTTRVHSRRPIKVYDVIICRWCRRFEASGVAGVGSSCFALTRISQH